VIIVKHGFAMARNVCSLMPVIVSSEMQSASSVKEESGIMADAASLAASASSTFVRIASLNTRQVARWLKQRT